MAIACNINRADILHRPARQLCPLAALVPEDAIRARRHDEASFGRDRPNRNLRKAWRWLNLAAGNHPQTTRRANPNGSTAIDANAVAAANRICAIRLYPRCTHQHTGTILGRNPWLTSFV